MRYNKVQAEDVLIFLIKAKMTIKFLRYHFSTIYKPGRLRKDTYQNLYFLRKLLQQILNKSCFVDRKSSEINIHDSPYHWLVTYKYPRFTLSLAGYIILCILRATIKIRFQHFRKIYANITSFAYIGRTSSLFHL